MQFTKEFLSEMMCGGWEGDPTSLEEFYQKDCELVSERITGQSRWSTQTEYIFQYEAISMRSTFHAAPPSSRTMTTLAMAACRRWSRSQRSGRKRS